MDISLEYFPWSLYIRYIIDVYPVLVLQCVGASKPLTIVLSSINYQGVEHYTLLRLLHIHEVVNMQIDTSALSWCLCMHV